MERAQRQLVARDKSGGVHVTAEPAAARKRRVEARAGIQISGGLHPKQI